MDQLKYANERIAEYEAKAHELQDRMAAEDITRIQRAMIIGEIDACYQAITDIRSIRSQIIEAEAEIAQFEGGDQ